MSQFWSLRDIFKEKVFYFVPSFQNSMRESSSGAENYKKDGNSYVQQNSIYNTYINFFYIIQ